MKARAFISWIPAAKGGPSRPPTGVTFRADVRFDDDLNWPAEGWTLVVRPIKRFSRGQLVFAEVEFLVPDAPHDLLRNGARFQLFDGRRPIAHGLVLPPQARPPKTAVTLRARVLC